MVYPSQRSLTTDAELAAALAAPRFLVFKHSLVCPVSAAAYAEYAAFAADRPDVPTAWIDVIGSRALARRAAADTGVAHESPQALWIVGGKLAWHASHRGITRKSLERAVGAAAPPAR